MFLHIVIAIWHIFCVIFHILTSYIYFTIFHWLSYVIVHWYSKNWCTVKNIYLWPQWIIYTLHFMSLVHLAYVYKCCWVTSSLSFRSAKKWSQNKNCINGATVPSESKLFWTHHLFFFYNISHFSAHSCSYQSKQIGWDSDWAVLTWL